MDTVTSKLPLCELSEIADGAATAVDLALADGEQSVIVLRQGDTAMAYLNICPHTGQRLDYAPGKFLLKDHVLVCAVHGATFNSRDGLCIGGPCRGEHLRQLPVMVRDGAVFLSEEV